MAQNDFLLDQVRRLSDTLGRTHDRPGSSETLDTDVGTSPAWLLDSEMLPPLLHAYDKQISELEHAAEFECRRANDAARNVESVTTSKDRMKLELRNALEESLRKEVPAVPSISEQGSLSAKRVMLKERLDIIHQENGVLIEHHCTMAEEIERLRMEKLVQARDHMAIVKQCAMLRDELNEAELRSRRATDARDRARAELQHCAAELLKAHEQTQQAMSIAERHAVERDAALIAVDEHRTMLTDLNARASSDKEVLQTELAIVRAHELAVRIHRLSSSCHVL
mmetsp:Transcript_35984/g.94667  ORF Transcript_35984/g.94667 Transcript_35984/m.94667 type:complete len:282 (+) Transcript_35984:552-1397(+)